jgi:hypothetical protein
MRKRNAADTRANAGAWQWPQAAAKGRFSCGFGRAGSIDKAETPSYLSPILAAVARGAHAVVKRPENAVFPCIWIIDSAAGARGVSLAFPAAAP